MNSRPPSSRRPRALLLVTLALSGPAFAADILGRADYIDYRAERLCAEKMYSYPDAASFDRELSRVDRMFGIKPQDRPKVDALEVKYMDDEALQKSIDATAQAKCGYAL